MNPLIAIAAQIFPEILKVVAGDQGGSIAQQVVQAVQDITGAKTADEARQKVAADPKVAADLQVKLAEIALNSQIVVAQQQLQEDAIAASSTSDARKNLAILAALDKPLSWTPSIISYIVIAGFFLIVFLLMFGVLKPAASTTDTGQVTVIQIVNICIGAIATAFATVIQFWLGSSLGSKNKDDALIQAQKVAQAGTLVSTPATSQGDGTSDGGDDGSTSKPTKPGPDGGPSEKGTGTSAGQGGPNKSTSLPTPAIDRFPDCVALTLAWEGGNDDDPRDRGGRTSRGITQDDWDEWRQSHAGLPSDVWSAPQDQIVAIYRQKYWNAMSCGQLPAGLDYCVFDYGVNSGIGRAAKVLQQFVGTTVDGEIGPLTIAAAAQADAALLVNKICDQRLAFLKGVGSWATFGVGWTRRVEGVRKQAAAMIGKPAVPCAPLPSLPDET